MNPRVWIIGENNPYQSSAEDGQRYAMYPEPAYSAGGRLCFKILGMTARDYLRAFERRNLLHQPKWSVPVAKQAASDLWRFMMEGDDVAVLLGRRVFEAFFFKFKIPWFPFHDYVIGPKRFAALPHPSGLSRAWNEPGAIGKARAVVVGIAPHLAPMIGAIDGSKICVRCHKDRGLHKTGTFNCPVGLKTRIGFTAFSDETFKGIANG